MQHEIPFNKPFIAGKVDKYAWVDAKSYYLPSEISCVLEAEYENADEREPSSDHWEMVGSQISDHRRLPG